MSMIQLTELQPDTNAIIRHLDGSRSIISRLAAMGFTPGGSLSVVRGSDNGPLLVCLRGSRVALGQGEASHIFVSLAGEMTSPVVEKSCDCEITIALAGQPNVGKSSVFNLLTGLNQHVGNWTGKTVENKVGQIPLFGREFPMVDLPGTYSLTANSEEERITRDYLLHGGPDLTVVVVNAAALERSLYLVAELLLLPVPLVIALNMTDVAEQEGIKVEPSVLEAALGIPVVAMVAVRGGIESAAGNHPAGSTNTRFPTSPGYPQFCPPTRRSWMNLWGVSAVFSCRLSSSLAGTQAAGGG